MFINTHVEARQAAKIAAAHGYTALTEDKFFRRYHEIVFGPWASHQDARDAMDEIAESIRVMRHPWRDPGQNR